MFTNQICDQRNNAAIDPLETRSGNIFNHSLDDSFVFAPQIDRYTVKEVIIITILAPEISR
jgi:hypothetical protein